MGLHVFLIRQWHVVLFLAPAASSAPLLKFVSPTASAPPPTPSTGSPEDHETTQKQERSGQIPAVRTNTITMMQFEISTFATLIDTLLYLTVNMIV